MTGEILRFCLYLFDHQNRPSVITCAPASNRNCNLSHCHMNGCSPSPPADQKKTNGSPVSVLSDRSIPSFILTLPKCSVCSPPPPSVVTVANTASDPVIEEHFRRSLGKNYKEAEPVSNSVSITGSVDDHFAKALGDAWLQLKAQGGAHQPPEPDL